MKALLVLVLVASLALANDVYDEPGFEDPTSTRISAPGPVWDGPMAELYSNGPWWNSVGTGVGGADESILESVTLGMNTLGFGFQNLNGNKMSDDFVIPAGETWTIQDITCFGYQTGSSTTPTINGLYLAIYDSYDTVGSLFWGDFTTNVFSSAVWTNVYRVSETTTGVSADRPIMAVTANLATPAVLTEGTYWLHVQMDGSLGSGPWAPPISILGATTTGNAYQYTSTGWAPALDSGTSAPQGIPFVLEGLPTALERSTWGAIKSTF